MKQSEDKLKFFDKYRFTMNIEMPHPEFIDIMEFEGLEAHYVSLLEGKVKSLEKYIVLQNEKIDFLMNKEIYKWKKEKG